MVCQYGILTLLDLNQLGLRNDSADFLKKMDDSESHINGSDGVSLAVVGLKDLYKDEYEYDPFIPSKIDFLVSSDIVACRNSLHYGNEFICNASIGVDKIASVDIRLLRYIKTILSNKLSVNNLINMYNNLIKVAMILHKSKLNIPLREMSYSRDFSIDVDKLCKSKYLVLK